MNARRYAWWRRILVGCSLLIALGCGTEPEPARPAPLSPQEVAGHYVLVSPPYREGCCYLYGGERIDSGSVDLTETTFVVTRWVTLTNDGPGGTSVTINSGAFGLSSDTLWLKPAMRDEYAAYLRYPPPAGVVKFMVARRDTLDYNETRSGSTFTPYRFIRE